MGIGKYSCLRLGCPSRHVSTNCSSPVSDPVGPAEAATGVLLALSWRDRHAKEQALVQGVFGIVAKSEYANVDVDP